MKLSGKVVDLQVNGGEDKWKKKKKKNELTISETLNALKERGKHTRKMCLLGTFLESLGIQQVLAQVQVLN